ncbi:MAG TPA: ester cyclase [Candidatus Acidoferrales bacterium]|nr:ester cyclase [Candidatus Acidoferrales bacterium]
MTEKNNQNLIRRYYEKMWNRWDYALADEILTNDISFRGSLGAEMRGREAFCGYMRSVEKAFPDFYNRIETLVVEGERAAARLTYSGTHRGEIFGIRPAGTRINYAGAAFFRFAKGKVAEGWVLGDLIGLLRQLGAQKLP